MANLLKVQTRMETIRGKLAEIKSKEAETNLFSIKGYILDVCQKMLWIWCSISKPSILMLPFPKEHEEG